MKNTFANPCPLPFIASLLGLAAWLGGCASGHTYVLDTPRTMPRSMTFSLRETSSTAELNQELRTYFREALSKRLETVAMLAPSAGEPDLTLEYRIVGFDKGQAGARVANGAIQVVGVPVSGLGDGIVAVEVTYRGPTGDPLARIVADGPIAGIFGTSRAGLDTAAGAIALYTQHTLHVSESPLASASQ